MTPNRMTVAVLGAGGLMGQAIAANLARTGFTVQAWNRSAAKAEPLSDLGVRVLPTPAVAASGADVVLTMLADANAVLGTMTSEPAAYGGAAADQPGAQAGGLAGMAADAVWVQLSTIGEIGTGRCAELAKQAGIGFFDAPVLGSRQPAEAGQLVVLASGPDELRPVVEPVFDAIGQRTMWLGEAGAGTRLKLVLNAWVVALVEAGAEVIALAEAFGLDPRLFFEAINGGALDLPYLRVKGRAMIERDFEPAFRLALAAKDAALVDESAQRLGLDLPMLAAVSERLAEGAKEHGDKDMSATYLTSARRPVG